MSDLRTPAEKRYDAEKDGSLYTVEDDGDDDETPEGCLPPGTIVLTDTIADYCFWLDGTGDFGAWAKGANNATVWKRARIVALYRFLHRKDVEDLMCDVMRDHLLAAGSPELQELVRWMAEQFAREEAAPA